MKDDIALCLENALNASSASNLSFIRTFKSAHSSESVRYSQKNHQYQFTEKKKIVGNL